MDYEKKYKEALERAKEIKSKLLLSHLSTESCKAVSEYIDTIIPELTESEDERALRIIKKRMCYDPVPISDEDRRIVEAWLEKQKEPHYTKRNALFDKCVENCDPEVMKEVSDKVDRMLGKEQKPSCWNSPVMTHEMIMEEQKEQKPAEWSEEDEKKRNALINLLHFLYTQDSAQTLVGIEAGELRNWLKSLRPSWKPSEEQMKALGNCICGNDYDVCVLAEIYGQLKKL